MAKKISMSLGVSSINEVIKKIKKLEREVNKAKLQAIREVVDGAYETILINTPFDTGETSSSTTYDITDTKAVIKQSGTHVAYNEFGTGPKGSEKPYKGPMGNWSYGTTGWVFYQPNASSRYYGRHYTMGQPAHAQMYKGSQFIRQNISKILKQKVSGALSKI